MNEDIKIEQLTQNLEVLKWEMSKFRDRISDSMETLESLNNEEDLGKVLKTIESKIKIHTLNSKKIKDFLPDLNKFRVYKLNVNFREDDEDDPIHVLSLDETLKYIGFHVKGKKAYFKISEVIWMTEEEYTKINDKENYKDE